MDLQDKVGGFTARKVKRMQVVKKIRSCEWRHLKKKKRQRKKNSSVYTTAKVLAPPVTLKHGGDRNRGI